MLKKFFWVVLTLFYLSPLLGQVRIMPLGDSITKGRHGEPAGYRDDLSLMLLNAGVNFDMVGSMDDGTGFYPHHEGHSGYRADEILANVDKWILQNPADIILLHIGTNDISQGDANESTILEIEDILDTIHNRFRRTTILLCNLIPRFDDRENRPQRTEALNLLIYDLFIKKQRLGWDIYFVDQNSAIKQNPNWIAEYMDDYVHPNDTGYHVMAETFFQVLQPLLVEQTFYIAGSVLYYSNQNPLDGVSMQLSGAQVNEKMTDLSGNYKFKSLGAGKNYTIVPQKQKITRFENTVITMYNAALTLRHAVGVDTLGQDKQLAADVDKNGMVTAFDAALIARYVVELDAFTNDHVGEWIFSPQSRSYSGLNSNKSNANFTGILLGDVDGAWSAGKLAKSNYFEQIGDVIPEFRSNDILSIPLTLHADSVLSFFAEIDYPENWLEFLGVNYNSERNFVINNKSGKVKVGFYESEPVSISDTIITLDFRITRKNNDWQSEVYLYFQINKQPMSLRIAKLKGRRNYKADDFVIRANYPNPFNPETNIPYELFSRGLLNVKIFNALGQEVKTLFSEEADPGRYILRWDGTDNSGMSVASGIYVCRFNFNNIIKNRILIKVQ